MKRTDESTYAWLYELNPDPYSSTINAALFDAVPPGLRLLHYTWTSVPAEHLAAFAFHHPKIGPFHRDGLPVPMHREMMFVIWRIIELGGRMPCSPLSLLMREMAETTQRLKAEGRPFESLMGRTAGQWKRSSPGPGAGQGPFRSRKPSGDTFRHWIGLARSFGSPTTPVPGGSGKSGTWPWIPGSRAGRRNRA